MFAIMKEVKEFLKLKVNRVDIDNAIFRLHYRLTVAVLLICCVIVTAKEYVGDPIMCTFPDKVIPEKVLNTFCWIYPTFTIPGRVGRIGVDVAQPGVATLTENDEIKYHKYYQWVCFMLFLQATLFYFPHYLWKIWECGKMKKLALDLNSPVVTENCKEDRKKLLVEFFCNNMHRQNFYVFRLFTCEALNFINVVGQIYLIDLFLGGEFLTYGPEVLKFTEMEPQERSDPMSRIFPKVTKCTFHNYGPTGTVQTFDTICVLPLNAVNEKIYIFLWFWFVLLSVFSGLCILYRVCLIFVAQVRMYLLRCAGASLLDANVLASQCQIGDWFVLYKLSRNIDARIYEELLSDLAKRFEPKERL